MKKKFYLIIIVAILLIICGIAFSFFENNKKVDNSLKIENTINSSNYYSTLSIKKDNVEISKFELYKKDDKTKVIGYYNDKNDTKKDVSAIIDYNSNKYIIDSKENDLKFKLIITDIFKYIDNEVFLKENKYSYTLNDSFILSELFPLDEYIFILSNVNLFNNEIGQNVVINYGTKYVNSIDVVYDNLTFNYQFSKYDKIQDDEIK